MRVQGAFVPRFPRILIPTPTSLDLAYNRQCWPQYVTAVQEAGGMPMQVDLDLNAAEIRSLCRTADGVLLPGSLADISPQRYGQQRDEACGPPDVARERCDWALLEVVFAMDLPLLAICYGLQSLNVFCGGTLLQDIDIVSVRHAAGPSVGVAHSVIVAGDSDFATLLDGSETVTSDRGEMRLPINSSHHQAVAIPGDGLRVVARSAEDGVVEALEPAEKTRRFLLGVQWHPERTTGISPASRAIFAKFLGAAAGVSAGRRSEAGVL